MPTSTPHPDDVVDPFDSSEVIEVVDVTDGGDFDTTVSDTDTITDIAVEGNTSSIDVSADCVTLIKVFTVAAENQARLIEVLETATEAVVRHQPGFISANLHAGMEGNRVANYAQWASVEDLEAMLADPGCREHLRACDEIAEHAAFVYRVASVHHR